MAGKVLVVDDAPEILSLLEMILATQGFDVICARNGIEALQKVKSESPAVIITDIMMPDMDGFAFFKELKKNPAQADIPVLILTARGKMEDSFLALGAKDFITKPFETDDLVAKVRTWIDKSSAAEEPAGSGETSEPEPVVADKRPVVVAAPMAGPGKGLVLLASSKEDVLSRISQQLLTCRYRCEQAKSDGDVLRLAQSQVLDFLLLEVLLDGRPSSDLVRRVRRISGWEKKPIVVFSFLVRDGEQSIHQQAVVIEAARTACLEAGATASIGGYDEQRFLTAIKPYLSQ